MALTTNSARFLSQQFRSGKSKALDAVQQICSNGFAAKPETAIIVRRSICSPAAATVIEELVRNN
jgi:hypothetical protein